MIERAANASAAADAPRVVSAGADAYLGLGSNMGDKRANLGRAIALLEVGCDVRVTARSRDWRTPPWGDTDQDWFVNACIAVETTLTPRALLEHCLGVERQMARVRTRHWGPRIIDVDILVYGAVRLDEPDLVIPHPRITERAFVLGPLCDIAPDLVIDGGTVAARLAAIDRTGVDPID